MTDKLSLPSSSFDEMVKIIKGYSHVGGPASLDQIAKLVGMNRTGVSANNKFLAEAGLIQGGNKKQATDLGAKLGRALDHNQIGDAQLHWKSVISANEGLAGLVTTLRIKGGMTSEELSKHILYVSGQKNTKGNRTGANALVEILKASGLVELSDGKLVVSQPGANQEAAIHPSSEAANIDADTQEVEVDQLTPTSNVVQPSGSQLTYQVTTQSNPQIAINIQLHIPETDNPEVYENLFRALKKNLLSNEE